MGSSAKKKKEKRKDFQKPKLKVGKTRPKNSNFTDTSFKAKSIVLAHQSLTTVTPTSQSQFEHHLVLLTHNSDTQKRESLAHLTSAIASRPQGAPLPQPVAVVVPKVKHLICNGSNTVRAQLLKLLQALPDREIQPHAPELLLWTQAGMAHMVSDIRSSSLDILDWLLGVAGDAAVSTGGGYVRTLKCFLSVLSWNTEKRMNGSLNQQGQISGSGWSQSTLAKPGIESKLLGKTLQTFTRFISIALAPLDQVAEQDQLAGDARKWFPLTHTARHMIPKRSNPYAHLNLFGLAPDEDSIACEDREERQEVYVQRFRAAVDGGLEWARKEQGEVGRAAKGLEKAIRRGLETYDEITA